LQAAFPTTLEGVGSSMNHVLHVTVFLKNIADLEEMNSAYREAFSGHLPARTVVAVSDPPKPSALLTADLSAVAKDA
jgi:2-iminobutanoate/2-iminopropanoate deaminase